MKSLLSAVCLCSAGLALADLAPTHSEPTVQDVAEGSAPPIVTTFGEKTPYYKTGAGSLSVSGGAISRTTDGRLTVLEGNATVTATAQATTLAAPAVCQSALFWVDMSSVVTTNGTPASEGASAPVYASKWCDVRETNPASPTRVYAVPKWFGSTELPALKNGIDPVVLPHEGHEGVFFGGRTSGQYMRWCKGGKEVAYTNNLRHIFFVHAVTNTLGHMIGYEDGGRNGPLLNTINGATPEYAVGTSMLYDRGDICAPQFSARFFLDGEQKDMRRTPPKRGWQLFEADYFDVLPGADNFGRSGFQETLKGRQGADYLGEVLVFTNRLTETERVAVERYLLEKWNLPAVPPAKMRQHGTEIALAEGATATALAETGKVTPPLSFAGAGNAEKTGEGVLALGPTDGLGWSGDFTWTAGALRLQGGRFPALSVNGGETYAFTSYNGGTSDPTAAGDEKSGLTCVKSADGNAGEVATTGNGWLRVHTVAPGVKRLKVGIGSATKGSVLQLEGRVRKAAKTPTAGPVQATFPNPDFEQPFAITDTQFDRAKISNGSTLNGWTCRYNSVQLMCIQNPAEKNTWKQWLISEATDPKLGTNVLQIVQQGKISTTVSVPAAGVYELSFDAKSRYTYLNGGANGGYPYPSQQPMIEIFFGKTWSEAVRVGSLTLGCLHFNRFHYRFNVASAGSFELGLGTTDTGRDACAFFDNFRLVRVAEPETEETVEIPNGNFDRLVRPKSSEVTPLNPFVHGRFTRLNTPEEWELSWLDTALYGKVVTNGVVGSIFCGGVSYKSNPMQLFPFSEDARGGGALGLVSTGGFAKVSFTVPAGTWRLKGLVQRCSSYLIMAPVHNDANICGRPTVRATITRANGESVLLGDVAVSNRRLTTKYWPTALTLAEEEKVTLTIEQRVADAFALVDDFSFVRESTADFGNLIENSNFENDWTGWTTYNTPGLYIYNKYRCSGPCVYSDRPQYWGYSAFEGAYRLKIQNSAGVYQDVTVPQTGLYRFKMYLRSRSQSDWYAGNPIRVWMAKGGVTNTLATVPTLYMRNWMEVSFVADVKEAGQWRFALEGQGHPDGEVYPADEDTAIDCVSFERCRDTMDAAPSIPENLKIVVAKGAQLLLDYTGSTKCGAVIYDGKVHFGTISAKTHPEFVTGAGTLEATQGGSLIIVR